MRTRLALILVLLILVACKTDRRVSTPTPNATAQIQATQPITAAPTLSSDALPTAYVIPSPTATDTPREPQVIYNAPAIFDPIMWSPDGRWITFWSSEPTTVPV